MGLDMVHARRLGERVPVHELEHFHLPRSAVATVLIVDKLATVATVLITTVLSRSVSGVREPLGCSSVLPISLTVVHASPPRCLFPITLLPGLFL
jgi:hypothetical protein